MRVLAFIFFLFVGQFVFGQVEITIVDKDTNEPLIGALVQVTNELDSLFEVTNASGVVSLKITNFPAELKISYLGYNNLKYDLSQTQSIITIELEIDELNIAVNPVIIANPFLSNDVSFNRKEFQVLPGAYEDPSRLLLKAPGFATANDQANTILFKGMPANFVNWNVNGALVVNPNHLSNAGTLSDISSANAGGVNMISGQVIGSYDFQSAPYKTPGNNAIAGNSNVEFSKYNNNYLNLSLVGLEAGFGYKGVQLNYRYSTVGILTGPLGLDFGGESIIYQDLFGKFDIIDKPDEKLTAHLVLGKSHNYKDAVMNLDSAETFKDAQNIYFDSEILVSGLRYVNTRGEMDFNASLNFSMKEDQRTSSDLIYASQQETNVQQQVISSVLEFSKNNFKFGANLHYIDDARFDLVYEPRERKFLKRGLQNFNIMPFVTYERETERFYFSAGSGLSFNSVTSDVNFEPHFKGIAQLGGGFELEAGYRRNSQILSASSFSYEHEADEIIGNHLEAYLRYSKQKYTLYGSIFGHYMSSILVEDATNYSQYSGLDHPLIGDYSYNGTAQSVGFSTGISTKDLLLRGLSLSTNITIFDSKFGKDGENNIDNTFDFSQSFNLVGSYNWQMKRDKDLVISLSYHQRGGLQEFNVIPLASNNGFISTYDFSGSTMSNLQDYTRVDFRIVYNLRKGEHRRFAKSISLDIQNLANRENDAFTNIDFLTSQPFVQKQLGLIPILAYRIEF